MTVWTLQETMIQLKLWLKRNKPTKRPNQQRQCQTNVHNKAEVNNGPTEQMKSNNEYTQQDARYKNKTLLS